MPAAAIPLVAAGVGAAGSVASSLIGSSAANKAANAQIGSTDSANQLLSDMRSGSVTTQGNALQNILNLLQTTVSQTGNKLTEAYQEGKGVQTDQYNKNMALLNNLLAQEQVPADVLKTAVPAYQQMLTDPASYTKSPYYDFLVSEGTKALERGAAAKGGLLGGAQQKALMRFGENTASTDYGTRLQQFLSAIGMGQNALSQIGSTTNAATNVGTNYANAISNLGTQYAQNWGANRTGYANNAANAYQNYANQVQAANRDYGSQASGNVVNAGNAQASGYINQANALSGGLSSGINNAMTGYYMGQMLNNSSYTPVTQTWTPTSADLYQGGGY